MAIALREIQRAKPRFLLLAGAIGLLVLLLLFFQATAGSLVTALTGAVERSDADLLVYQATARGNPAVSVLPEDVAADVGAVEGVAAAAPVGQTFVVATRSGEEEEAVLLGVEPDGPGLPASPVDGRVPATAGQALFSSSGFSESWEIGDVVTLQGSDVELVVVGIAEDAAANASPTLYVPLTTYADVLRSRIGEDAPLPVSFVAVTLEDAADPGMVTQGIESAVEEVEAYTQEAAVDALPGISTITRSFGILYLLLYLVASIVTGVFFLILTVQKRDALVLLTALGGERRDVIRLVLTQVAVVVGAGVLVGAASAWGVLRAARDTFGATLDVSTMVTSGLAVLAIGLVSSLGAIRRVTAIEPVEATRSTGLT